MADDLLARYSLGLLGAVIREKDKQNRRINFIASEAALSNSTASTAGLDYTVQVLPPISKKLKDKYARCMNWFVEFCEDVAHISDPIEKFFKKDKPLPDIALLRRFICYCCSASKLGRGSEGTIAQSTALGHAGTMLGALARFNQAVPSKVRDELKYWIITEGTDMLHLNTTITKFKPVAMRPDVDLIIDKLLCPLGLRQVSSMRVVLNILIFINLMLDTGSRPHEVTKSAGWPEVYLRWKDLKVYAFNDTGNIFIHAKLKVRVLEGGKNDPENYKECMLGLLPFHLGFQDSLRLLLNQALLCGHIVGIKDWVDLENMAALRALKDGYLIKFTKECQEWPLLPRCDHSTGTVQADVAEGGDTIPKHLGRVGRLCGFAERLQSYALRRGAGFEYDIHFRPEVRNQIMGHQPGSHTYDKHYRPYFIGVDAQTTMTGTSLEDFRLLMSMSLRRGIDPPMKLSDEGYDEVWNSSEVVPLRDAAILALDKATSKFGTLTAARKHKSLEHDRFKKTKAKLMSLVKTLCVRKYRSEYDAFIEAQWAGAEPQSCSNGTFRGIRNSRSNADICDESSDDDDDYDDFDPPDQDVVVKVEDAEDDDDQDIYDISKEEDDTDDGREFIKVEGDETDCDYVQYEVDSFASKKYRQHGAIINRKKTQRLAAGAFDTEHVLRPHDHDDFLEKIKSLRLPPSSKGRLEHGGYELGNLFMSFFAVSHPLERYGPLAPLPATFLCPSCNEDQVNKSSFESHINPCKRRQALAAAQFDYDRYVDRAMATPCTWVKAESATGLDCGETFNDRQKFILHTESHIFNNSQKTCGFRACIKARNRTHYQMGDEINHHVAGFHNLPNMTSASNFTMFCAFCNDYLHFDVRQYREQHYAGHLDDAIELLRQFGYNAVISSADAAVTLNVRHPYFCVFCVHDVTLSAAARLSPCNESFGSAYHCGERDHIHKHFLKLKAAPEDTHACPAFSAGFCGLQTKLTLQELEAHLIRVHFIFAVKGLANKPLVPKRIKDQRKKRSTAEADTTREPEQIMTLLSDIDEDDATAKAAKVCKIEKTALRQKPDPKGKSVAARDRGGDGDAEDDAETRIQLTKIDKSQFIVIIDSEDEDIRDPVRTSAATVVERTTDHATGVKVDQRGGVTKTSKRKRLTKTKIDRRVIGGEDQNGGRHH